MSRSQIILLAIASSFFSSVGWIFQERAVTALTPLVVASLQCLLTGAIYLIYLVATGKRPSLDCFRDKQIRKQFVLFIVFRGLISNILLNAALLYSPSIKIMFLTKLEPYFVLILAWLLFRRTVSNYHLLLLLVHVGGAVLLSTGGLLTLERSVMGDLLVITAVTFNAYSYLQASRLSTALGAFHINGIFSLVSGLLLLPAALYFAPGNIWSISNSGWWNLMVLVVLYNVLAVTLWFFALKELEEWLVSALRAVGPVLAAPLAWLMLQQTLSFVQICGAGLILLTSALLARDKKIPKRTS